MVWRNEKTANLFVVSFKVTRINLGDYGEYQLNRRHEYKLPKWVWQEAGLLVLLPRVQLLGEDRGFRPRG